MPALSAGVSLAEAHSGANAAALCQRLRTPVYTRPAQHYCAFLSDCHLFALPLDWPGRTACLVLATQARPLTRELAALARLTVSHIAQTLRMPQPPAAHAIRLTARQRAVLLCLARGMTDRGTAATLHVCPDTVKYHKRRLFALLDVNCTVCAVTAALRVGLITVQELGTC